MILVLEHNNMLSLQKLGILSFKTCYIYMSSINDYAILISIPTYKLSMFLMYDFNETYLQTVTGIPKTFTDFQKKS